jgi:hypothetical protein
MLGCKDLILAIDHKPLLKVLGDRKLEHITNPCLQSLKKKTLLFLFHIIHMPGKKHFTTEAMSRYASREMDPDMLHLPDDAQAATAPMEGDEEGMAVTKLEEELTFTAAATLATIKSVTWDHVCLETSSDPTMRLLHDMILMGFPKSPVTVPNTIRIFYQYREVLSVMDEMVLNYDSVVVTTTLQDSVPDMLHTTPQGVTFMMA